MKNGGWKMDNKEKKKEYDKKYYQRGKDKVKERIKKRYKNNKENILKQKKEYYENNKEKIREIYLKRKYGLTIKRYNRLLKKQGGVCAICRKKENGKGLAVDHNHQTGNVRGLLCQNCNTGIGLLNDNIQILQKTIKYLKQGETNE